MNIALIVPIADDALSDIDDSRVIADVPRQALCQYRPELLSVLSAGLNYIELIAYSLRNITFAVILAELIIKIRYRACEAEKLLTVELVKLELLPVL